MRSFVTGWSALVWLQSGKSACVWEEGLRRSRRWKQSQREVSLETRFHPRCLTSLLNLSNYWDKTAILSCWSQISIMDLLFFFFLQFPAAPQGPIRQDGFVRSVHLSRPLPFSLGFCTYYKPFPLFNSSEGMIKFCMVLPQQNRERGRRQGRKEEVGRREILFI